MANQPSLGETIRQRRISQDITLRELARRLDLTPSYLSDIENDRRVPAEDVLARIAGLLDLSFDELMGLAGRFGDSVERYLKRNPAAGVLFRRISQANLSPDALKALLKEADRLSEEGKK
jgi:transcriptional regulator with XRE-family HTH domain